MQYVQVYNSYFTHVIDLQNLHFNLIYIVVVCRIDVKLILLRLWLNEYT